MTLAGPYQTNNPRSAATQARSVPVQTPSGHNVSPAALSRATLKYAG